MAKSNFDDFLLDPSFDDLDSVHLEAERQLYKKGGFKKKVKSLFKKKKKKDDDTVSDKQAAEIDKVANTNPKGGKSTVQKPKPKVTKKTTVAEQNANANQPKKYTVGKVNVPKVEKKTSVPAKKINTKRGTGKTYKMAKYKNFAEFKAAAEVYNKKSDAKKAKAKPKPQSKATKVGLKTVSATEKKKLLSKSVWDKIPSGGNKM